MPEPAVASAVGRLLNDFYNVFFVLQIANRMIRPEMLHQGLYITANRVVRSAFRAEDTGILSIWTIPVAFDHEAVGNVETPIETIIFLYNLPRFSG